MTTRKKIGRAARDGDVSNIRSVIDLMEIMPFVRSNGKIYSSIALVAIWKLLNDPRRYRAIIGSFEEAQRRSRSHRTELERLRRAEAAKEKKREYTREYYKKNKGKFSEYQKKYRAKKAAANNTDAKPE